jgi:hypothetical protein
MGDTGLAIFCYAINAVCSNCFSCFKWLKNPFFKQLDLDEADTIKSNSMLIFSNTGHRIYTQMDVWC